MTKWHYPPELPDDTDLCLFEVEETGPEEDGFHLGYHSKEYSRWDNELHILWCLEDGVKRWMKVEDIVKEGDNVMDTKEYRDTNKWNDIPEHPPVKESIFSEKCLVQLHSDDCYTGYYNARDNEWLYSSYGFMAKDEEVRRWILISDLTSDKAATGKDYYGGNACYEAMKSVLTAEELRGFCIGNAFKYIWRHHGKGDIDDIKKAYDYLGRALDIMNEDRFSWAQAIMESEMEDEDG